MDAQYQDLAIIETISPPFEDKFHSILQKKGPNAHLGPPYYCISKVCPIGSDKMALRSFLAARRGDIGQEIMQIVLLGLLMGPTGGI